MDLSIAPLPVPRTSEPRNKYSKWLLTRDLVSGKHGRSEEEPWYKVLWLTGVDYFSTLGYQPGIALLAAGALAPFATLILVLVTLFCALPTYCEVAKRSYAGQGSIAILERLLSGWWSKLSVLVLIGFAATDFIITITLSAADASLHIVENPIAHEWVSEHHMAITLVLISALAIIFLRGFKEAIRLATLIAIPYIGLNLIVLGRAILEVSGNPQLWNFWGSHMKVHGDWTSLFIVSALVFPKLALGMSGFETGVSVMPLIRGTLPDSAVGEPPTGRIQATKKLLLTAALIMSVLLLLSSLMTSILITEEAYQSGGQASGRAIAYLAHKLLGHSFGTLYDLSTILILWFAGASAMAGLLNLIPRYLPQYGMAPRWVAYRRPLVLLVYGIAVLITLVFDANVEAQGGAYATGVLALMLSASVAVAIGLWREEHAANSNKKKSSRIKSIYFGIVSLIFAYTFFDNIVMRPDGAIIAGIFILVIVVLGAMSRWQRALDLRVEDVQFEDESSAQLWKKIIRKKVHLVPLRTYGAKSRKRKETELRSHYSFKGAISFIHVSLYENRSDFLAHLKIKVEKENDNYVVHVTGATAVANAIAYVSELIDPISIFVGLTRSNLMTQSLRYLLWGEGEHGILVYQILLRYWEWTPRGDVRPRIFLMSE